MHKDQDLRFERKVILTAERLCDFEFWLRNDGIDFKPVHQERYINNIYFDSPDFESFNDNVSGCSVRRKCRLRWYGDVLGAEEFQFEVKCRQNQLGYKYLSPFRFNLDIQKSNSLYKEVRNLIRPELREFLDISYTPVVFNRYKRRYLVSRAGVRLTVDTELSHCNISFPTLRLNRVEKSDIHSILEVKYGQDINKAELRVLDTFGSLISKNSKYINAVNLS